MGGEKQGRHFPPAWLICSCPQQSSPLSGRVWGSCPLAAWVTHHTVLKLPAPKFPLCITVYSRTQALCWPTAASWVSPLGVFNCPPLTLKS
jgi:hypothetical protein